VTELHLVPDPAAPAEESLQWARWQLARLHGDVPADLTEIAAGRCDECERRARARWRLGVYALCRHCIRRRTDAAKEAAA
jgi:hypothetical protein